MKNLRRVSKINLSMQLAFAQTFSKNVQAQQNKWKQAICKLSTLSDSSGQQYLYKHSLQSLILRLDRSYIQLLDSYLQIKQSGLDLLEFVRFFLNILPHDQIQNIYLAMGLVDLFRAMCIYSGKQVLSFHNITNYLCQRILERKQSNNMIEAKNVPNIKFIKPKYQLKQFISSPAVIYGNNDQISYKLSLCSIMTDKNKHTRAVNISYFSYELSNIYILDSLSEYIAIYDYDCHVVNRIYPSVSKFKKDIIILSFAFSQRQLRIGAVLKNFFIVFWDSHNRFQYEKIWLTTTSCQYLQTSIKYLEYFDAWITMDKNGGVCFWDLLTTKPSRQMKCKYSSAVTNIIQISALNLLAIVQQSKKSLDQHCQQNDSLFSPLQQSTLKHSSSTKSSLKKLSSFDFNITLYNYFSLQIIYSIQSIEDRVPHTISYSEDYQILFSCALEKKIKLFELNPVHIDANIKGELVGHDNLITSFTLIKKTSLLVSCDDKGKIKMWDFKQLTCIQTIDFSDKALITNLLDMIEIGKIGIFGSRVHYIDFQEKAQIIKKFTNNKKLTIQWIDYDSSRDQIFVFTQKDMRIVDMHSGRLKLIYASFKKGKVQDYTCFRYFEAIERFAIGNDKGEVSIHDINTGSCLYVFDTVHEGSVLFIEYDQLNKIFLSVGQQSTVLVHRETTHELLREMKANFYGKQISCFQLSVYHNLIALSTNHQQHARTILLWNYQYGKLSGEIILSLHQQATCLKFINSIGMLMIGTNLGHINLIKTKQISGYQIKIQQLITIQLSKPIHSISCEMILRGLNRIDSILMQVFYENGDFQDVDLGGYVKNMEKMQHCKQKINYNPYREGKQTFMCQYTRKKYCRLELEDKIHKQLKIEDKFNDKHQNQYSHEQMEAILQKTVNIHENKHQQIFLKQKNISISPMKASGFNVLNLTRVMRLEKRYIMVVGIGRRLKIFEGEKLVSDLNINYPLPYLWGVEPVVYKKVEDRVYFGVKVLNKIMNRYQFDISITQAKNFRLEELFEKLGVQSVAQQKKYNHSKMKINNTKNARQPVINKNQHTPMSIMLTQTMNQRQNGKKQSINSSFQVKNRIKQIKTEGTQKIALFQLQYTKNDLNFDMVKEYNFHEIAGPTLKQLDHKNKMDILQREWKEKEEQGQVDRERLLRSIQIRTKKNEYKQQLQGFLSPRTRVKQSKEHPFVSNVRKALDNCALSTSIPDDSNIHKHLSNSKSNTILLNLKKQFRRDSIMNAKEQIQKPKQQAQKCIYRWKKVSNNFTATGQLMNKQNSRFTFQDYYQQKNIKGDVQIKEYQLNRKNLCKNAQLAKTTGQFSKNKQMRFKYEEDDFIRFSTDIGFKIKRNGTRNHFEEGMMTVTSVKSSTAGSKFRRILTQMNDKVREKKIEKVYLF